VPSLNLCSIVAVHGLLENALDTWSDRKSKTTWLQGIFPYKKHNARIVLYEYDRRSLVNTSNTSPERVTSLATTFVEELCADRQCDNGKKRPIVFICHGFGGLLVKSALAYSQSARSEKLEHLRSIYVSTFGILFLATPHHGIQQAALGLFPETESSPGPSQFVINLVNSDLLQDIEDRFVPMMKGIRIFNFWEQLETQIGDISTLVVDEASAAPVEGETERCGVMATHVEMTKFADSSDPGYTVVHATLVRYILEAHHTIESRWRSDREQLGIERREQASALFQESMRLRRAEKEASSPVSLEESTRFLQRTGTDLPSPASIHDGMRSFQRTDTGLSSPGSINEYYLARVPVKNFTGRQWHVGYVTECLGSLPRRDSKAIPKIFVIHGMGGSGKTQLCRKFASENKQRYI
jgi:Putative serine esterase (DUF676)